MRECAGMKCLSWRRVAAAPARWAKGSSTVFSTRAYHQPRVFFIAGEPSGDVIGSRLMASLRLLHPSGLKFAGVGGPLMEKQGLNSEFPMDDLSVMGALELLPHLFKLRARLHQTLVAAESFQPDIVVAIDSKGFSFRVLKGLRAKCMEQRWKIPVNVLYVAPSAWAWKDGEKSLKKWVGVVDHILCILPFEELLCKENGLAASFVGHPALEDAFFDSTKANAWISNWHIDGDKKKFFSEHSLPAGTTLLSLLPGSRLQEVKRMMPIYKEALEILKEDIRNLSVVIPTTFSTRLIKMLESSISNWDIPVVLLPGATLKQKYDAFNASAVGLCTSGTAVLQMLLARLPCVIAYRANIITEWLIKRSIKLRYMSLPNILLDSPIIPEAAFSDCRPCHLAEMLRRLFQDDSLQQQQVLAAEKVLQMLSPVSLHAQRKNWCINAANSWDKESQRIKPSMVAAKQILSMLE